MLATLLPALSGVAWTFSPTSVDKRTASRLFDLVSMLLRLLCCLAQMFCCAFFWSACCLSYALDRLLQLRQAVL